MTMNIKIHRGQNQIGGSIIEVSSNTTRLIFDIGLELGKDDQTAPEIDGLFVGKPSYDAVFISHYHADHLGLAQFLLPEISVYMGEKCFAVNKASNEYRHIEVTLSPHFIRAGEKIVVGDIAVTPFLCDHSAFDSYMFLLENGGKKILYTGDYRSNGRKSFDALIDKIPQVNALITEGTSLGRDDIKSLSEAELEDIAAKEMKGHHPVFILQSATNIDRIVTAYKAASRNRLVFLEDLYMAGITSAIGGSIPNPISFSNVRVFPTDGNRYDELKKYGGKAVGKDRIAGLKFAMCVRQSMQCYLDGLSRIMPFEGGILFYSMWSGYKEQEGMQEFLTFMESKGITVRTLHTSGHADREAIRAIIAKTNPDWIVPVHTENAQWFCAENPTINVLTDGDSVSI